MSKETYPWHFHSGRILVAIDLTEHLAGSDPKAPLKDTSDKYVRKGLAKHLREHGYVVYKEGAIMLNKEKLVDYLKREADYHIDPSGENDHEQGVESALLTILERLEEGDFDA